MIEKKSKKRYEYFDGSGNRYIIKKGERIILEYIPIKPQHSSSGVYNGGDYIKKEMKNHEWKNLISIIKKAIKKEEVHIKNRIKKSGMIIVKGKENKKTYIIGPNTEELFEINNLLQVLIKN
ncbi:MAG: hypothetical protein EU539_04160 [Promethearchaeota archaeon]|nr:MAG: hypothetical protein EU539_04160 [Candidatus Lokiarchaeota archaeon]